MGDQLLCDSPALSSRPGHTPTHEATCPAEGKEAASGPISAMICYAESSPNPGTSYTFGNSGTGILTGPSYFNVDLGLVRHFSLLERLGLDLRGEWFNAFNHPNFSTPNATIGTAQAGVISSTFPARIIQLALKLTF